ncbi:hypothetical protein JCM11251_001639 [Rhodosporidiobolus azoricus]
MRPALSLLPVLAALSGVPASASSSPSPSPLPAVVEALPPRASLFSPAQHARVGTTVERAQSRRVGESEEEASFGWVEGREEKEVEVDRSFPLDGEEGEEEEERRREEEEEREMWRELLGSLSERGEVHAMFKELVAEPPTSSSPLGGIRSGAGEGGQTVFAIPDSSSHASSSSSPASLEPDSPHVAPPPSLLPPPFIPDEAEYHAPPQAHSPALNRKIRLFAATTVEGLLSLLRPIPLSFPLPSNHTLPSLTRPSLSSLSLVAHPLQTLKTRLPPGLGLSFAAPAGIGISK